MGKFSDARKEGYRLSNFSYGANTRFHKIDQAAEKSLLNHFMDSITKLSVTYSQPYVVNGHGVTARYRPLADRI